MTGRFVGRCVAICVDAMPRSHSEVLIAALMPGMVNNTRDVGGSAGEASAGGSNTIHGGTGSDQVRMIDGLWVHDFTASGNINNAPMSEVAVQEYGRIDDPQAGWKGRGLWTSYATVYPWQIEGGKGTKPKAIKVQMRPDPLAK